MSANTIAQDLANALGDEATATRVKDVRIGLLYTAVQLEDGRAGVALTMRGERCSPYPTVESPLVGRSAADLLSRFHSTRPVDASVALATANALANQPGPDYRHGHVLELIEIRATDHVGMVGEFKPVIARLKPRVARLTIFELIEQPRGNLRPTRDVDRLLPDCDLALITATSLINGTADRVLVAAHACREVVMLGATTPLCPEAFFESNVTLLAGVVVREPDPILRIVSEGGGMAHFGPHVDKVALRLKGPAAGD